MMNSLLWALLTASAAAAVLTRPCVLLASAAKASGGGGLGGSTTRVPRCGALMVIVASSTSPSLPRWTGLSVHGTRGACTAIGAHQGDAALAFRLDQVGDALQHLRPRHLLWGLLGILRRVLLALFLWLTCDRGPAR